MTQRIWDPYLTASDKEHLARTPDRRVGMGNKPALLLVDLSRAVFVKDEGLLDKFDQSLATSRNL